MKKIVINSLAALSLIAGTLSLNSCRDAIDIEQPGELNDAKVFTSVNNMNDYLIGTAYADLEPSYATYLSAVITDEVKPGSGSGGQDYQLHRFYIDNRERYTSLIWQNNYNIINRVNRLLQGASKITPSTSETQKYNSILAQARALRAFAYLQIQTYFSTDMKKPDALGAIIVEGVPSVDAKPSRSTNAEVNKIIEQDLDYARSILSTYGNTQYYVDRGMVDATAARFYLYTGQYDKAQQFANSVVSNSGLILTSANPILPSVKPPATPPAVGSAKWNEAFYATASSFNPYRDMWVDNTRGEIIFALNRLPTGGIGANTGSYWNTNNSTASGTPMWVWGRNLFNIFYNTDGDVRRYAYVDPTAKIDPNYANSKSPISTDVLVIDKFPGKVGSAIRNDIKIFRLSEMYFILAECAVRSNDLSKAREYVHAVRTARNYNNAAVTPNYTSTAVALADILKERRIELALEGHRYIDLKRLAVEAGVSMDRNATDDVVKVENLPNGSYKYTLPIPLAEISGNPNAQQNPGY